MVHSIKNMAGIFLMILGGLLHAQELPLATLLGHGAAVNSIDLSPDGKVLISGGKDETIRVWNLQTLQLEHTIKTVGTSVKRVSFNAQGTRFLAALYTRFAEFDARTWKQLRSRKKAHSAFVETCGYSTDGKLVLSSSWRDNTLVVWSASNLKKVVEMDEKVWVDYAQFNRTATQVFSGGHDNLAKLWDVSTGALLKTYAGHDDWVYDLCLSPDEKWLYTGSFDRTVRIWEVSSGKNITTLKGHKEGIVCIALSAGGRYLASAGMDKDIIIWDLEAKAEVKRFTAHEAAILDLKFSSDGQKLFSCSLDQSIKVWELHLPAH